MRTEILIRIVDENNVHKASFCVKFQNERDLDDTVKAILPLLINKGVLTCEHLDYDLQLQHTKLQKGSVHNYNPTI